MFKLIKNLFKKMECVDIAKTGLLFYLVEKENSNPVEFEPSSYDEWKEMREREPSKMGNDYDFWVRLKKEQFEQQSVEPIRYQAHKVLYDLNSPDQTYNTIITTELQKNFHEWCDEGFVNNIKKRVGIIEGELEHPIKTVKQCGCGLKKLKKTSND